MAHALEIASFGFSGTVRRQSDEQQTSQWSEVRTFASWLPEAYDRLRELTSLRPNWDSHGARAVGHDAITGAKRLLSAMDLAVVPKPHICATADGGVGLHWRLADRDLEIEVATDGDISYLQTTIGGEPQDGTLLRFKDAQHLIDWLLGVNP